MIPDEFTGPGDGNRLLVALAAYTPVAVAVLVLLDGLPAVLRVPIGAPVLLFAPGYAVVTALLPGSREGEREDVAEPLSSKHPSPGLSVLERGTLSVLASTAIVPVVALALSPLVGVATAPTLVGVAVVTVVAGTVAVSRRSSRDVRGSSARRSLGERLGNFAPDALTVVTGALVIALLAGTALAAFSGGSTAPGTEFYVADVDGSDAGTVELRVDHEASGDQEYTIVVATTGDGSSQEIQRTTMVVSPDEVGRTTVDTAGLDLGGASELRFLLYRGSGADSEDPHRTLQLSLSGDDR
jgi:uncharacterized membrane protein